MLPFLPFGFCYPGFVMRLHILVLDGVFDLGLAAISDTLATANELARTLESPPPPIDFKFVGVRSRVRTAQGLTVPVLPVAKMKQPEV
jgi:hypothetical protein